MRRIFSTLDMIDGYFMLCSFKFLLEIISKDRKCTFYAMVASTWAYLLTSYHCSIESTAIRYHTFTQKK